MAIRLENWGRWAAGSGAPRCAQLSECEGCPAPVEADALRLERAMLRVLRSRPTLYQVARQRYLLRRVDVAAASACRCSVRTYQRRVAALHAFVRNALSA